MAKFSNFIGKRSNWSIPYAVFLIIFVALPLVLIMGYAFVDEGGGFTLNNISRFFGDSDALSTFAVSIEIALETTAICLLLGYPVAWLLVNSKYTSARLSTSKK